MHTQLVISLLAPDAPGLLARLTSLITQSHCLYHDSRIAVFGETLTGSIIVDGSWDRLAKLETALEKFQTETGANLQWQRAHRDHSRRRCLPYIVDAIGLTSVNMPEAIAGFLANHSIRIRDFSTHCYLPQHSNEPLTVLRALVDVPADLHLGQLKSNFFDLCDRINLDAALEPDRSA